MQIQGEELLGPQASLRVTPCPPAPNHTRGEVKRRKKKEKDVTPNFEKEEKNRA